MDDKTRAEERGGKKSLDINALVHELERARSYFEEQDVDFLPSLLGDALNAILDTLEARWHSPRELPQEKHNVLAWGEFEGAFNNRLDYQRCFYMTYVHNGKWFGPGKVLAWCDLPYPPTYEQLANLENSPDAGNRKPNHKDLPYDSRWIPCCEREPDHDGEYLATVSGTVLPEYYEKKYGGWMMDGFGYETTAWMPMPEPYSEGGSES